MGFAEDIAKHAEKVRKFLDQGMVSGEAQTRQALINPSHPSARKPLATKTLSLTSASMLANPAGSSCGSTYRLSARVWW
jgi:hypothetical protein